MPNTLHSNLNTVGRIASLLLLFLLLGVLVPISPHSSSALDSASTNPSTQSTTQASSSLSLALDSSFDLDLSPTPEGTTQVTTGRLVVSTTNPTGYKVYLRTLDSTNALVREAGETSAVVQPVGETLTLPHFQSNTWGFSLDQTNYQAVPLDTAQIAEEATMQDLKAYDFSIAAKLDTTLPAGEYSNNLEISVIANPAELVNLTGFMSPTITKMQDMTSAVCQATQDNLLTSTKDSNGSYIITKGQEPAKQLIDSRDNKKYWVSKLADGNCWMTQNLAYDLVKGKVLTPSDSDVKSNWTVPTNMYTKAPTAGMGLTVETVAAWNLGNYVMAAPEWNVSCPYYNADGSVGTRSLVDGNASLTLKECENFQDVSGWTDSFVAKEGIWQKNATSKGKYEGYVAADSSARTYDAHYLVGNYYLWNAATAGSGVAAAEAATSATSATGQANATASICPRGWGLPVGEYERSTLMPRNENQSFYRLLRAYGYPAANYALQNQPVGYDSLDAGTDILIRRKPFYWVLGGHVYGGGANYGLPNVAIATRLATKTRTASVAGAFEGGAMTLDVADKTGLGSTIPQVLLPVSLNNSNHVAFTVRCVAKP